MHNIFQPLSSVALLQQRRQNHLKKEQLKWELADWDLTTRKQKAGYCQCTAKKKNKQTNQTNLCTTECTCKSTSFRWVKGGEGRGGEGRQRRCCQLKDKRNRVCARVIDINFFLTVLETQHTWNTKGYDHQRHNALIFYQILPTNSLRKCMEIRQENLYVDIGA